MAHAAKRGAVAQQQQAASKHLIKPPALKPGDTIGMITPATYVSDPDRLAQLPRMLAHFGLRMKMGKYAGRRMGDYRSSVEERLDDFHSSVS
ncbi:MAG: hypothetical protein WKF84_27030 [Pyrinomonadaceae bacterium]